MLLADMTNRPCAGFVVSGDRFDGVHSDAGWSSPVARQAHNLKVVGSNPTPAPIGALKS
eukprot:CAMPEP_0204650402 /NCGR_PEP_ID=MMETSP0718-20130828/11494_1 /ASSEMBLY_ACC=CAM_ASM_000674 /TAXON_ID=230516 /ORGANISM="Chaetoceros curvisetus" /LENGTH=58 /DNA_ID=CAMNT_0051673809 /DNA_START=141 /DNA_END=317 /DNA_ORIENTATION=+